jgi:2-isopropylmalate synthase
MSVQDKLLLTHKMDDFGIDIIEGGWPGSNPKDEEFFSKVKLLHLNHAVISAFGSTARELKKIEEDANLKALLKAETPVVSIFGKTWRFHSEQALGITAEENEELIFKSVQYLSSRGRRVIFDAEHFFDGFKSDADFAVRMLKAAQAGGASTLALCDTNGGMLSSEIFSIIKRVTKYVDIPLGIHTHNDCDLAVANALSAVEAGAVHIQGTLNGVGERCGNANLISIIPNLLLKMNATLKGGVKLNELSSLSKYANEIMNLVPDIRAAYTGKSAFAHKGGIHVSAVLKDSRMYEHINPEIVGNKQRVLVSDLSGKSNIIYKADELGIDLSGNINVESRVVKQIKALEHSGYQFDGAEASFELILRTETGEFTPFFKVLDFKVNMTYDEVGQQSAEAIMKIEVDGEVEHTASDGEGPVNALDNALRKALTRFYPEIANIRLNDYKVRVLEGSKGTRATVRVLIQSGDGIDNWATVGVSDNIIEASFHALCDSINYSLFRGRQTI